MDIFLLCQYVTHKFMWCCRTHVVPQVKSQWIFLVCWYMTNNVMLFVQSYKTSVLKNFLLHTKKLVAA